MKTDSRFDEKPNARMPNTARGLLLALAIAIGAGLVGFAAGEPCWEAEVSQGELRVVRASVTWREGGRELSVVHVAEPAREPAPHVAVIERGERRTRLSHDPTMVGREIRTAAAAVTTLVRLLATGKLEG